MSVDNELQPDRPEINENVVTIDTEYSYTVIQPLLIAAMVVSLVTAALAVFNVADASWPWRWFIPLTAVVALEGIYTTMWLHHPDRRVLNRPMYRLAEMVVIFIVVRLFAWWLTAWPEDWIAFVREPLLAFSDGFFLLTLIVTVIAWQRGVYFSHLFFYMRIDPAERAYYTQSTTQRRGDERPMAMHRTTLMKGYGRSWLGGGVVLAFLAALATIDLPNIDGQRFFGIARLAMPTETLLALLVYFGSGFALLSQARLATMNARWLMSRVEKTEALERSWSRNTLWVLLIVGGIAAFLPLGSTTLIGRFLEIALAVIAFLTAAITFLVFFLLSFMFPGAEPTSEPEFEPPPPVAPPSEPAADPQAMIEVPWQVTGTLFWLVALTIAFVAIGFFLRERGITFDRTGLNKVWQQLRFWWLSLWKGVKMQVVDLRDAVVTRLVRDEDEDESNGQPWRFIRLNALTPRQKLRYFYLSTVRRAEEQGVGRLESETPLEYAADLKESWPDTGRDVDVLTQAFLKARYSPNQISESDVNAVQENWKQLRRELRRRVQQEKQDKQDKNEASAS